MSDEEVSDKVVIRKLGQRTKRWIIKDYIPFFLSQSKYQILNEVTNKKEENR